MPEEFSNFTYSKLFQPKFISDLGYKLTSIGDRKHFPNITAEEFQSILINCLIRSNIPEGSRLLSIGRLPDILSEDLSEDYELYVLSDAALLAESVSLCNVRSIGAMDTLPESLISTFDCAFTISGFDDLSHYFITDNINKILLNLRNILKASALCFFTFKSFVHNGIETMNSLAYYFFRFDTFGLKPMMSFTDIKDIAQDSQTGRFEAVGGKNSQVAEEAAYRPFSYNIFLTNDSARLSLSTITKPRDYLQKNPAYIFHHLIKCGGSSLVKEFSKWFTLEFDHILVGNDVNELSKYKYNLEVLTSDVCITSHFHYNSFFVSQRYPEILTSDSGVKLFTFVRDPLSFQVSMYYFERQKGGILNVDLDDFLGLMPNFMATLFPCTEDNYKEVLDRYFFIGILERMQESVDKLAWMTNKRPFIVKKENISKKDYQKDLINEEVIERFKQLNKLDYMIYEYCLSKFESIKTS